MPTFAWLFNELIELNKPTIYNFLQTKAGYEKQEAVFKLFAYLGLIPEFADYEICNGNFNKGCIQKNQDRTALFNSNLKDKGDKADLKLMSHDNTKIIVVTSKNLSHISINKLDLGDITNIFTEHYKDNFTMAICIVVPSKAELNTAIARSENTSKWNKDIILNPTTIIFDWDDLNAWYQQFIISYKNTSKTIDMVLQTVRRPIIHRPHGLYGIRKILSLKEQGTKNVLLGMIQRSGKTHIIGGVCASDKGANYLIITTAPSETIDQYISLFQTYSDFDDFNIIRLNASNKKPSIGKKNIVICSKQFLQSKVGDDNKVKQIKWLKDLIFDIRFIDESHNGGSTEIAKKILTTYGASAFTVYVTATYIKPVKVYEIPQEAHITWDIEDIKLCKSISIESNKTRLIAKHGSIMSDIIQSYTDEQIMNVYSVFPDLHLMTFDFKADVKNAIIQKYKDRPEGFSTDALFLLKQVNGEYIDEFQDDEKVIELCYTIFGKTETDGLFKDEWDSILKRIIMMCKNANINSRTFTKENPLSIIAFLPTGNIDKLQTALKNLIVKHNVLPDFEIVCLCGKINGGRDAIECINDAMATVRLKKKKGLLILTGTMCSLGVSLPHCDIALMLNNSECGDQYFQMIYRCMTEANGKKCGFVVDLNLQRVTSILVDYALKITSNQGLTVKESIKYIFKQKLIGFNNDEWMHNYFGLTNVDIHTVVDKVYSVYSAKPNNAINTILKEMEHKMDALNCIGSRDQKLFNTIFHTTSEPKSVAEAIEILTRDTEVKKGIEKVPTEVVSSESKHTKDLANVNIIKDVLKHLLPLMCLLTVHNTNTNTFIEMCNFIESNIDERNVLITQLGTWWGKVFATNKDVMSIFVMMYNNYLKDDTLFNTTVMRLKEMFCITKNNRNELSKLIDTYLVPQAMEKKQNAEVSTPYQLRQEMLNSIPKEFWTESRHVFEPCAGKGGFLLDIVSRFEEGLHYTIPDTEERYEFIVENCLYWSDINPVNIWICKLLLDPFGKYDLKYNLGDTLELDIKEKWKIDGFDAVIGNPPYSTDPSKQDTTTLYNLFTEAFIEKTTYLLYVTPSRWFIGGKGLDKFRKMMMKRKDIRLIVHNGKCKEWFGNAVEIKGGCSYFLIDKTYKGPCNFNGVMYDLDKYDVIIQPQHHAFINKTYHLPKITDIYMNRNTYNYETNDKRLKDAGNITVYVSSLKTKDRKKYIDTFEFNENNKTWKVITTEAAHGAESCFGDFKTVLTPDEIYTSSYIGFRVSNESEGKSLISYLNCKLPNYLLSVRKISQHINTDVVKWVPLVPLDRIWNDKMVDEYFNISA